MAGSTLGTLFRVTTFGESHGAMIGACIDGCPSGLPLDLEFIQSQLDRRRPGQSKITTQRNETDHVQIISGVFEGKTTGAPICALIRNQDQRPADYSHLRDHFRPSHADFTYQEKYGIRDYRGGGRSSARETAARVVAGAIAQILLKNTVGISIQAFVSQVGSICLKKTLAELNLAQVDSNLVRCPDPLVASEMIQLIDRVRQEGDTIGGVITGVIQGCPIGLGEPVFDRLHADLGKAMLSINAVKGFEYGSGFQGVSLRGSEHNDPFTVQDGLIKTRTNHSGGIQGGISNGMNIEFKVAFKPVATLLQSQATIDSKGNLTPLEGKGRHDPCIVPRAVPIVEAMAAITLADHFLRSRTSRVDALTQT